MKRRTFLIAFRWHRCLTASAGPSPTLKTVLSGIMSPVLTRAYDGEPIRRHSARDHPHAGKCSHQRHHGNTSPFIWKGMPGARNRRPSSCPRFQSSTEPCAT